MQIKYDRQHGGTLIGIIIGLVIGLSIAFGVALVITKTPIPFTDKSGRSSKPLEPGHGQPFDLNKPLYGNKAAAKDAAKDFVRQPEANPPVNTAAQPPEKTPEAKAESKAEAKKEGKAPVTELSAAAKKPADEAPEEKWNYYLQAGAFREQADAETMRGKLALMGVEAKVSERQAETGTLYRVRVGPFGQLDAMNKARGKLSDNGVDAAVVRVAKQ